MLVGGRTVARGCSKALSKVGSAKVAVSTTFAYVMNISGLAGDVMPASGGAIMGIPDSSLHAGPAGSWLV